MAQIAVTILDPSNNRSAHLVETQRPVRDLLPPILAQLKLPEQATYQLIPLGREEALLADKTLAESGIPAGAELLLKPIRNQILKAILDKLYEEAQGYVEDQAWGLAKEKLTTLLQLDPTYPDPLGLERALETRYPALRSVPPTESFTQRSQSTPATTPPAAPLPIGRTHLATAAAKPTPPPLRVATPLTPGKNASAYQLAPTPKSSGMGCVNLLLLVLAVLIGGTIAVAGAAVYLPNLFSNLASQLGITQPNTTILGTGDVQVTLRWQGKADLDLHMIDPEGQEISFVSPRSASGGTLDVDANGECEGIPSPVENIFWPPNGAPRGIYQVTVVLFQLCGQTAPTDYEVTITLDGEVVDVINAQISNENEIHPVANFEY